MAYVLIVTVTFLLHNGMTSQIVIDEDSIASPLLYTSVTSCHFRRDEGVKIAKEMIRDGRIAWPEAAIGEPQIATYCRLRGLA